MRALLDWASREDMLIIEDDPYGDLIEDVTTAADTKPIAASDTEGRVIYQQFLEDARAWFSAPRG